MVYGLKLLLPVLLLWVIALLVMRSFFRELLSYVEFRICMNVVLLCTVVEFLSIRIELFLLTSAVAAIVGQKWLGGDVRAKITMFWMAVFLFPPLQMALPGFGGINHLLILDHFRVLSIVLLVPAALKLMSSKEPPRASTRLLDIAVLAYPLLQLVMHAPQVAATASVRSLVELVLDVGLPYFVFTRGLRSWEDLRHVLSRVLIACTFAGLAAFLEAAFRKNIYSDLEWVYGMRWSLTHTLMRGGMNRVQAMTPEPIIYAMQIMLTMGMWMSLAACGVRKRTLWIVLLLLAIAMFLTWSRGPWIGAAVFGLALFALNKVRPLYFALGLVVLLSIGVGLKVSGADESVMALLKNVFGSSQDDSGSIEYRSHLLTSALALIKQSPWLGVPNYGAYLQDLRQGEGIVDLVNSYIAVTLDSGVVGLAVFMAPFIIVLFQTLRRLSAWAPQEEQYRPQIALLRAFVALLVGCLFTIFTTSMFERVPFILLLIVIAPAAVLSIESGTVRRTGRRLVGDAPGVGFTPNYGH